MSVDIDKLEKVIKKIDSEGWIDNNRGDAFDGQEFDIIFNSLKEYLEYRKSIE